MKIATAVRAGMERRFGLCTCAHVGGHDGMSNNQLTVTRSRRLYVYHSARGAAAHNRAP